jgi:pSer/pThr/pTyr-binding forkhead associated (FHA) protein
VQLNADQGVSRQHAEIYTEPNGQPRIRDLNSTHGTYVNGQPVSDTRLSLGDRVTFGQSTFLFTDGRG